MIRNFRHRHSRQSSHPHRLARERELFPLLSPKNRFQATPTIPACRQVCERNSYHCNITAVAPTDEKGRNGSRRSAKTDKINLYNVPSVPPLVVVAKRSSALRSQLRWGLPVRRD